MSNGQWRDEPKTEWLDGVLVRFEKFISGAEPPETLGLAIGALSDRFDELMSYGFHWKLLVEPGLDAELERLSHCLEIALDKLVQSMAEKGRTDYLEKLAEAVRDCLWQIRREVLDNVQRTLNLMPEEYRTPSAGRERHFAAWAIEQVMENIDRLEVRGRDSAGIAIQCRLPQGTSLKDLFGKDPETDYPIIEKTENNVKTSVYVCRPTAEPLCTFLYKIANLVGKLGDNTSGIRAAIRTDDLLWKVAGSTKGVNIIAHTRWASNGIISLNNCHPADGLLTGDDAAEPEKDRAAMFVLNGDVDNYKSLVDTFVTGKGYRIDPSITTDAKILPVYYRLGTDPGQSAEDRFLDLMNKSEGSLAIVMQHPYFSGKLFLGQKGSGQSLFVGRVKDGFIMASEVYGLATRARESFALKGTERGGTQVTLSFNSDQGNIQARYLEDSVPFEIKPEPIYIHSRDIFRGTYNYYFEKEIHEAPSSVRKTIKGKYRKIGGKLDFLVQAGETFSALLSRLRDTSLEPIKRIMIIGQGTASVAAKGAAYLIERALAGTRISVGSCKASEMSGFLSEESLEDMLLIAISQSGTTTDTNRTVDVAGSQGAWIHSIVNRRNSPLVTKSNSYFYTGDGRDIEMAVASTKAFYSQITAAKLTAMLLAQEFATLSDERILEDIEELEKLPEAIEKVLESKHEIMKIAETFGPSSRNWAVVGNGPNKIAADEIRIKLSELCYKSIPCDFTEDKKHIDLSTEPLTIVVANDLPEQIIQDTAKEVAIFKAHSGKPLVMCSAGEHRFNEYAESLIRLPIIGGGLGFVLATVAGHLWGFYAAKAIDARADEMRNLRSTLTQILEDPSAWNPAMVRSRFLAIAKYVAGGEMNASLPASCAAGLGLYAAEIDFSATGEAVLEEVARGITVLNKAIEEMTRPIDSIRHQAKTVTVGISRPQEILPPVLLAALESLAVKPSRIRESDRRLLRMVSSMITEVNGGLLYKIADSREGVSSESPWIKVTARFGSCCGKASRYDSPKPVGGSKRTVFRLERAIWNSGPEDKENLLIIPLFEDDGGMFTGILLFHLTFISHASPQQKLSVLRGLGNRYHEVVERIEEVSGPCSLEEAVARISPRNLILGSVEKIVREQNAN